MIYVYLHTYYVYIYIYVKYLYMFEWGGISVLSIFYCEIQYLECINIRCAG